ncbi:MAG: amino acid permease [Bacteroidetes bacterium]|nr:amino acid permease [Bacteroidota bacterium]
MTNDHVFRKSLNLFDSTAIVVGSMIGSGIFIVSADIARQVGAPGLLMAVWLITGFLTICAALSYGELAGMFPKAGGQYVYLKESYNPLIGFLYGWTLFLVIQTGTIAAVGMAFAKFLGVIIPWVSESVVWCDLGFINTNLHIPWFTEVVWHINLGFFKFGPVQVIAILSIVVLTWINTRGIKSGKRIQNAFTSGKFLLLLLFILIGLIFATNSESIKENLRIFWEPQQHLKGSATIPLTGFAIIAAMGVAMVGSLFSSDAWNNITFTAGEVINPKKNIPMSLFLGTSIVTILYLLANVVYLMVLPFRGSETGSGIVEQGMQFAVSDRLGTATIHGIFGAYAALIMAGFVVISTFGCNNGLILSGARVYYAMADNGLFFKKVGQLNDKGVPASGLIFQCIWASLLCLSGTYGQLLDYVVFAVLIFYVLTIAGIFILRIQKPELERPYKAFGYPVVPAIYILIATFIMVILFIYKPNYTWPGLIIVLLGIPVYFFWHKKQKPVN